MKEVTSNILNFILFLKLFILVNVYFLLIWHNFFLSEQRTFGARRRIMMALLPVMYKMGVMTTMLGVLVVLALKGITIGIILLFLSLGSFLSKFKAHGVPWQPQKPLDIHVHVHTDSHKQAYSGWHYGSTPFDYTEHHES